MAAYKLNKRRRAKNRQSVIIVLSVLALLVLGGVLYTRHWYLMNLQPVSSSQTVAYFTVEPGETKHQIALDLQRAGLIRSARAFEGYVRSNEIQNLQAGTYKLTPSMSVTEIVRALASGDVARNLLTILPGKRLDQVKQTFLKAGYSRATVDRVFNPDIYRSSSVLSSLPKGASLEGYLYPDSFQREANTPAETIVSESLDEMQKHLSYDITSGFAANGLNIFQGITLASIVEQESTSDPKDQAQVAQVFLLRLKKGMPLGSDVTAYYASAIAGQERSVAIESPYNTRIHTGLPPGPIGSTSAGSLSAVAHPAKTSYLYFLTDDNGSMRFSYTKEQHEDLIRKYCQKACGQN